jgi:Flp pilus assembly protein TadD
LIATGVWAFDMKFYHKLYIATATILAVSIWCFAGFRPSQSPALKENLYRLNNRGVAQLEQFNYREAAESFRKALEQNPRAFIVRLNLAIALYNLPDMEQSLIHAQRALELMPNSPNAHYMLGLIARSQNRTEDAINHFQKVLTIDSTDPGTNINLGQVLMQQRKYEEAEAAFRRALQNEPYNATATYNLSTTLMRMGKREEGQRMIERFQHLRESGSGTTIGQNYLEQGIYAEAIASRGDEAELISEKIPLVRYVEISKPSRLQKQVVDKFASGVKVGSITVADDFDNDGQKDLFVLEKGRASLFKRTGRNLQEVTTGIDQYSCTPSSASFLDIDHDGDLDIVTSGLGGDKMACNFILRNNGDGKVSNITKDTPGFSEITEARMILPTDFDNRRDVDLLVIRTNGLSLLQNRRDGSFVDVSKEVGLTSSEPILCVTAGDVNKDGFIDFYFGISNRPGQFFISNGRGSFRAEAAPLESKNTVSAQFLDYDNDGLVDLVVASPNAVRLFRNLGRRFMDVTRHALNIRAGGLKQLVAADFDTDGDMDLILLTETGSSRVFENRGGNSNRSLRVNVQGKVSNRAAVGAKVEVRAGSLLQKLESYSTSPSPAPMDLLFGLGQREYVDAVRVIWPSGIVQTETAVAIQRGAVRVFPITEVDRKPSSCPYLFVWNGKKFEFLTDFMGGGEIGYWLAPGVRNMPDPDEYVRIPSEKLQKRDGRYELRVTNELEEVLFLDHLKLIAVTHSKESEIYPNEGLFSKQPSFKIFTTKNSRPPIKAIDSTGRDVRSRIVALDRKFSDTFSLLPIRGYAKEHALEIDVGPIDKSHAKLLLTGSTDYAFSSDNLRAYQQGLTLKPPSLQIRDKNGRWKTAIEEIGIPVGRPQTVVVDLSTLDLYTTEVRIATNMRIYWDRIAVDDSPKLPVKSVELRPEIAQLKWRGYSRQTSPDGLEPFSFDYERVSTLIPWKLFTGSYTREGDVRELLSSTDDIFVVSKTGDEIALKFMAPPSPPPGYKQTFLLYVDGFSKEMDINSASPDQVEPIPYHAMKSYPYKGPFPYKEKREYMERFNTRVVRSQVLAIDSTFQR